VRACVHVYVEFVGLSTDEMMMDRAALRNKLICHTDDPRLWENQRSGR